MFLWLLVSLFGLFSVFRTTICIADHAKCDVRATNYLLFAAVLLNLFVSFVLKEVVVAQFLLSISIFLTPLIIPRVQLLLQRRYLSLHFVSILDEIILEMRMGRSFRESFQKCSVSRPDWMRKQFDELLTALAYRQAFSAPAISEQMVNELREVFGASMKQLERLKSLRRRLKIEMDFRQKSRRALVQVRMQSAILSLLFVPLLVFQLLSRPWDSQGHIILVSCLLFAVGTWWISLAGRKYKWKI